MPTAAQDLNDKLRLESQLRPILRGYNSRLVRAFRREYVTTGNALNTARFDDELINILNTHYDQVTRAFDNRITPTLPLDVAATEGERDVIAAALVAWMASQAVSQAEEINTTTQTQGVESIEVALDDEMVRAETGRSAQIIAGTLAAAFLSRKLMARESGILMTETQIPAEVAKATEAEVLSGLPPSISGGSPRQVEVTKEWATVGDSRVRLTHLAADGQVVTMNSVFTVGGEQLRYPGDMSLGASLGNIINCRCSAVFDRRGIIDLRKG